MISKRFILITVFFVVSILLTLPIVNAKNVSNGTNFTNPDLNSTVAPVEPYIMIDPIGNHVIGDIFFINGTTNLPVSQNLTMEIVSL